MFTANWVVLMTGGTSSLPRPIVQSRHLCSSHVKLITMDGTVAIQGNGN